MEPKKVILISPPFSSQLTPTLALARAFRDEGVETIIACGKQFKERIGERGIGFVPLLVNRNANTGVAQSTQQPEEERKRLHDFLESTKRGAVETLMLQSRDRKTDMLADPHILRAEIEALNRREKPNLWIANQLSYAVTLVLHCLDLPFITFCPPHPLTIPQGNKVYGVPASYPGSIIVDSNGLKALKETARSVELSFTEKFNRFIAQCGGNLQPIRNAFRLTSSLAILYNYPDFWSKSEGMIAPQHIYMGYCFEEEALPQQYEKLLNQSRVKKPKILIVMGTFLSYRQDVLQSCIDGVKKRYPDGLVIVGAGASAESLMKLQYEDVLIEEYVPQKALIPHMDVIVHHGGNNSFTESLYYGKPMVILPFSSDQFDVAADAEEIGIAEVPDPNSLSPEILGETLARALAKRNEGTLLHWQKHVRQRGPGYAVREIFMHI
jgi:UDP:flavonoid glycosyltransferase YjiC (YdhE family)